MSPQYNWRAIGASQRGASHIRTGSVCQDAIHWLPEHGVGPPLILSVADGHGSHKHFRSGIGARLAVDAAEAVFCELLTSVTKHSFSSLSQIKKYAEGEVPRNIVKNWLSSVETHVQTAPFTSSEVAAPIWGKEEKSKDILLIESNFPAYGSTILSVLAHEQFIIYVQLGDGNIISISEQGEVDHIFSARLLGTETNSLSQARLVWISNPINTKSKNKNEDEFGTLRTIENFRVHFQIIDNNLPPPAMILLSTDGLANSYRNDDDFEQFGMDIYRKFINKPFEGIYREVGVYLSAWLDKITRDGSGDDITLGILCRENALQK